MRKESEMERLLWKLGANHSYTGFDFIVEAVEMIKKDRSVLQYITKGLYLTIAIRNQTSDKCVERDIRTVIEMIWKYGNRELLEEVAGRTLEERPNNREFLEILARYIPEHDNCDEKNRLKGLGFSPDTPV